MFRIHQTMKTRRPIVTPYRLGMGPKKYHESRQGQVILENQNKSQRSSNRRLVVSRYLD